MENHLKVHSCCEAQPGMGKGIFSPCPGCGRQGQRVATDTVLHLLKETLIHQRDRGDFLFCRTPSCSIVYYVPDGGPSWIKDDLRVRVGLKETEDPVWICYCFNISEKMIQEEIRRTGQSAASDRIRKEVKEGTCQCEIRNPSGRCCLGEVRAVEKRLLEREEKQR